MLSVSGAEPRVCYKIFSIQNAFKRNGQHRGVEGLKARLGAKKKKARPQQSAGWMLQRGLIAVFLGLGTLGFAYTSISHSELNEEGR